MKKSQTKKIDNKQYISKCLFFAALFILLFIFTNIAIPSLMFIFKINIHKWYAILATFIAIIINYLLIKKYDFFVNNKSLSFFLTIIIPMIIISLSIFLNGKVYDYTWDGNSYHKSTIGMMAEGWNPVYENMEDFDSKKEIPMNVGDNSSTWGNHYAKASHIYAASIYKFTGNIETGKSINTLSIIMLFMFVVSFLLYRKKGFLFTLMFGIVSISYPVVCAQFLTNYVDLLIYLYLYILLLTFFMLGRNENDEYISDKTLLFQYFMTLTILINIKFSSFAYAGIYCLGYYIWYIYRLKKHTINKEYFKKFSYVSFLAVIVGVFVIGLSVYPKNFIDHGNPFYPLMGKDKIEIMIQNEPKYFESKSPIEKFIISTFSKTDNISRNSGLKASYKIPFTIEDSEMKILQDCDTRISGNGVLFSGILITTLILLICFIKTTFKKDKTLFYLSYIPILITFILIFTLQESWWARYFPQLYILVLLPLIFLSNSKGKVNRILLYIIITLLLINNFLVFYNSVNRSYNYTYKVNNEFYIFKTRTSPENCDLNLYTETFHGAYYNIIDKEKDYKIQFLNKQQKNSTPNNYALFMDYLVQWRCK
jgi:hypothetical protein